jgi:hypothetical protein
MDAHNQPRRKRQYAQASAGMQEWQWAVANLHGLPPRCGGLRADCTALVLPSRVVHDCCGVAPREERVGCPPRAPRRGRVAMPAAGRGCDEGEHLGVGVQFQTGSHAAPDHHCTQCLMTLMTSIITISPSFNHKRTLAPCTSLLPARSNESLHCLFRVSSLTTHCCSLRRPWVHAEPAAQVSARPWRSVSAHRDGWRLVVV